MQSNNSNYIRPIICLVLGLAALVVVGVIGYQQTQRNTSTNKSKNTKSTNGILSAIDRWRSQYANDLEKTASQILIRNFQGENIKRNLRELAKKPHRAGTEGNMKVADWIHDQWKAQGLQDVHFAEYDVLLSYPADTERPNTVELLSSKGELIFRSIGQSPPLIPDEQSDYGANLTFNAYSASGTVSGELVYVNYGSESDYEYLDCKNISLKGKIAIVRYGMGWRGAKVYEAQSRGAIGVIIYSDPAEACPNNSQAYPHSVYMPERGAQLGSLLMNDGDPLTPLYPSVDYTYRSRSIPDLLEEQIIPSIPVQPMGYGDAYQFLSKMKGQNAPDNWQGGLNFTYRIDQGDQTLIVRMTVRTNTTRAKIKNVIGFIEGRSYPDQYVIVGNHFDAWIYGAIDPNSGTATMLEMSRSFMQLINETAWRPRRTIVFCAWDAEEYGLHGSTEWVEQYATLLDRRAVAYLNVDLIPGNETLNAQANPTLMAAMVTAAKRIQNPDPQEYQQGRKTVYDTWFSKQPSKYFPGYPDIHDPAGGSDHVSFFKYLGIPVVDVTYENISNTHKAGGYPLYHTLYETPFVEEKLLDIHNFSFHVALGQFWAELARLLADSDLLPLNADDYAKVLKNYVADLNQALTNSSILPKSKDVQQDVKSLKEAIEQMLQRAQKFHFYANELRETGNPEAYAIHFDMFNSRLQQLERCFINPRGDPESPDQRHIIYGIQMKNSYESTRLPLIYRQIEKFRKAKSEQEKNDAVKNLRQHISILHYSVNCATALLKKTPARAI